ncbi:DNA internalization-related competence protein ComEC/Rec2 [Pseudomonas schmalbachii]|uniref:DNA internalization-related competence protein ComEC/Rec2 n=1 Tax=Pseudomonas schmalbachii TaxID=2816993 RepID=A0ABS3TVH6_9PSED|nr:DNA internalization-related competence protein ComEC/Rec2 [Pseudomonas schmalbachii]MBO3277123.1 DNA internalization-related competence protein ComEC/Rec2 [Pseudomonas schmalbachii]
MIALAAGLLSLRFLPALPPLWVLLLLALGAIALLFSRVPWLGIFLIGFVWACLSAQWVLDDRLSKDLDGGTLWLEGRVSSLPDISADGVRFDLEDIGGARAPLPRHLRLSWYGGPQVQGGERWRLAVKLKRAHGLVNEFGFDYEAWLTARRIGATGSVKDGKRLQPASGTAAWREAWRQRLLAVDANGRSAALAALVLGDASGLTKQDWQILQDTGTLHLMVISGSHISLLAGLLYALVAGLARMGAWPQRIPWLPCACALALLGAWSYALMAGFEIPARRACVMISLMLLWRLRFRHLGLWLPLLGALCLVLLFDPLASLTPGFWLSFGAVELLIFGFAGRLGRWAWWRTWSRAQWLMALGLTPMLLALGLPVSLSGALANLIAVPWVELAVVPLALLGSLLLGMPLVGEGLVWCAGGLLELLFRLLAAIAALASAWQPMSAPVWAVSLAMLGALLLLLPAGVPLRLLGMALWLPALWPHSLAPDYGQAEVRVLDVGQGLSVLVRTHGHAWLYDAGPRSGDFDLGERVVVPMLHGLGIGRLDMMMLSHADSDHAGGALAVFAAVPVDKVISGEPQRLPRQLVAQACRKQDWEFDGVRFSSWAWAGARESNARSCVLRIEAGGEVLLLTGDLPLDGEQAWLTEHPQAHVDWLLAGHHGSRSSSGALFLRSLAPEAVLISRGRNNPYGHPHPQVLQRLGSLGIAAHDTAEEGALKILLGTRRPLRGERENARFWREK